MFSFILTALGLVVFEVVNSVDNAVINAEVLGKMSARARRWFLLWGMLFAVLLVRGLLPWIIVMIAAHLGPLEAFTATWSSNPEVLIAMEKAAPMLRIGAGIFLILLFLHWLFREEKSFGLRAEAFVYRHGVWFYAISSIFLTVVIWSAVNRDPMMAFAAAVGSTVFFITHGFKENATFMEEKMIQNKMPASSSDWPKIFYLEAIDAAFSIDGVLGAFAFTLSIPLILIGNGIGAVVVRILTASNIERVKRLPLLKNGAMYSILSLGIVMICESFGVHIASWISPVITFVIIGYFFWLSLHPTHSIKT